MAIMVGNVVLAALREAGIADDRTRRVVIDIGYDCVPIIHIERIGDDRLLKVVRALEGVQITREERPDGAER